MAYYRRSEQAGWFTGRGPCASLLAEVLSQRLNGAQVVPVANGTLALMIALRAAFGNPRRKRRLVAVPSFTCPAVGCALLWAGFEPLFIDIAADSWHPDPAVLAANLKEFDGRVAGVLAATTFGTQPTAALRQSWRTLCKTAGIPLIVDSAAGLGSCDDEGREAGAHGDTEVFSFGATKPSAVGEGGVIVTSDTELAERCRTLVNYGSETAQALAGKAVGLNGKLPELLAAAALAMLDRLDEAIARRRSHARLLTQELAPSFCVQAGSERSTWPWFQVMACNPTTRERALRAALAQEVETRTLWDPPLHQQKPFQRYRRSSTLEITEDVASRSLSLPMATHLSADELERIAAVTRTS
jgi:dTDP-4-amino-4,6-dideoxygalactose transaminase